MTSPLPELINHVVTGSAVHDLILDGTKIGWWRDRVEAWKRGEKIAPVTMDVAWTRKCNAACSFCISGDEAVVMADGSRKKMRNIQQGEYVRSIRPDGQSGVSLVRNRWLTRKYGDILRIETSAGDLQCTPNHEVLTPSGWRRADALTVGDSVVGYGRSSAEKTAGLLGRAAESAVRSYANLQCDAPGLAGNKSEAGRVNKGAMGLVAGRRAAAVGEDRSRQETGQYFSGREKAPLRPHETIACGREDSAFEAVAASSADLAEKGKAGSQYETRALHSAGRTTPSIRSDAADNSRRQDYERNDVPSWSAEQTKSRSAGAETSSYDCGAAGRGFRTHEDQQSDASPRRGGEGRRDQPQALERGRLSRIGAPKRVWAEQGGSSPVGANSIDRFSIYRRWKLLDWALCQWQAAQSRFYLQERNAQDSRSLPWSVLACAVRFGRWAGIAGLFGGRLGSLGGYRSGVKGRSGDALSEGYCVARVLAIRAAGVIDTHDLDCAPFHNFIAGAVVVKNCFAQMQASDGREIKKHHAFQFLEDAAEIGVKGISLISDGESTVVPWYEDSIEYAASLGIKIGIGTNGVRLKRDVLERILPHISYLRYNFSAGERKRYSEIMGLKGRDYDQVVQNVKDTMEIVRRDKLEVSVNLQMVTMPSFHDQIMPLARLAQELRPHYLIYKHCSDNDDGFLGVDYKQYDALHDTFKQAEALADDEFRVVVKWARLADEGKRHYSRCLGPPFQLQMSGNGLISSCGFHFNEKFKKFHMGNIVDTRFRDIFRSDRYWEVIRYLASDQFDPRERCGTQCLQTHTNQWLFDHVEGRAPFPETAAPAHLEFL